LVLLDDRHPVRVIGQGDHDALDDEAARGGAGAGSDQVRQLVPGQPLLMDGRARRNGGSSRLIRDEVPLGPVACLVGRCTTPGRLEKKPKNRESPGAQISDESIAAARAGPAEGLLIPLRLRLDNPHGPAMPWPSAKEIPVRNQGLAIRMAARWHA
jgi:hypothetical protein